MAYLVGYHPKCGCVTAWLLMDGATVEHLSTFMKNMIESGRAFRPEDDEPELLACPHDNGEGKHG